MGRKNWDREQRVEQCRWDIHSMPAVKTNRNDYMVGMEVISLQLGLYFATNFISLQTLVEHNLMASIY